MNWIKKFRETYGLSLRQLAHLTGKTVKYISVLETRSRIPSTVSATIQELEEVFLVANNEIPETDFPNNALSAATLIQELHRRIERREIQLSRLAEKLKELKKRQRDLLVLQSASSTWKAKKLDTDPDILTKTGPIESGIKVEILRCGPASQARIRLKMARVQAEIDAAKEEIVKISPYTSL
jgi:hypothetical protein